MKSTLASLTILGLGLILVANCGDSTTTPPKDAAADKAMGNDGGNMEAAPADMATEMPAGGACDPAAQDCGMSKKCDVTCAAGGASASFGCITDSGMGAAEGATCGGSTACAKGNICLTVAMASKCRKYCSTDADCTTGPKVCETIMITVTCGGATDAGADSGTPPGLMIKTCKP